jgi:hypothetical protein
MLVSVAAVAVAAVIAGSFEVSASTTLSIQLIHRCPPATACVAPRIVGRMRDETERIWSSLDVRIEWFDSRRDFDASRPLGLTVLLEGEGAPAPLATAAVLATMYLPTQPCEGGVARIWVRNVRHHIASVHVDGVPFTNLPNALGDLILARALGRALAHEIGHYLLGTGAHTERGLMRARFAPLEFVESLGPRYGLSARERESLTSCRTDRTQSVAGVQ